MAGLKKIARPINMAKNTFTRWLKDNGATLVDEHIGDNSQGFVYYRHVTALINSAYYSVYFVVLRGKVWIEYSDSENKYENLSIDEFLELI